MSIDTNELRRLAEGALENAPHGWWQKSWDCPDPPHPEARELGELLCCFVDEETPRFWDWINHGRFVATFDPPMALRLLDEIDRLRAETAI